LEWIEQRQHASLPTVEYLIIACTINPLAKACNVTLVNLQQRNLCLSQQTEYIEQLVQNILLMVNIQHEDNNEENSYLELGVWWVTFKDVLVHVKDQGT
jgi:H2-forming N5,N10-methylenetetrahydromethanopterin dehydrogenase-like enzyme